MTLRSRRKALLVFGAVLLACAGCDHAAKQIAMDALRGTTGISLAGDSVRLQLASNAGAFLSLGERLPESFRDVFFLGLVPLLLAGLCARLLCSVRLSAPLVVGLGLVAGGGLANWLDRLLHDGAVTDFIVVTLGPLRTGVFNLADVAIVAGVVALAISAGAGAPRADAGGG